MKSAYILICFNCLIAVNKANALQRDTIYKLGDFLIEASGTGKIDFAIKNASTKIKTTNADTLYEDEKYLIRGDKHKTSIFGIYKRYKLKYNFLKFPAAIYKRKLAPPDFSSDPEAKLFRTQIKDQCKTQGINFAGHYTVAEWGCGSDCQQIAIIDRVDGKIYYSSIQKDIELSYGIKFKPNSRLAILNSGLLESHKGYVGCSTTMSVETVEWLNGKARRLPE